MRALRMSLVFVLVVAAGMGAAVGARMLTDRPAGAGKPAAKTAQRDAVPFVVTRPGGKQLKLTKTMKARLGAFTVKAPATTAKLPGGSSTSVLALSLRGADDISAMFVVNMVPDGGPDPVAALRRNLPDSDPKVRALRRTQVAGGPAATTDRALKGKHRIRQFRFVHDGEMYGVAIAYYVGDRVGLDTGLAMLASWKWTKAAG